MNDVTPPRQRNPITRVGATPPASMATRSELLAIGRSKLAKFRANKSKYKKQNNDRNVAQSSTEEGPNHMALLATVDINTSHDSGNTSHTTTPPSKEVYDGDSCDQKDCGKEPTRQLAPSQPSHHQKGFRNQSFDYSWKKEWDRNQGELELPPMMDSIDEIDPDSSQSPENTSASSSSASSSVYSPTIYPASPILSPFPPLINSTQNNNPPNNHNHHSNAQMNTSNGHPPVHHNNYNDRDQKQSRTAEIQRLKEVEHRYELLKQHNERLTAQLHQQTQRMEEVLIERPQVQSLTDTLGRLTRETDDLRHEVQKERNITGQLRDALRNKAEEITSLMEDNCKMAQEMDTMENELGTLMQQLATYERESSLLSSSSSSSFSDSDAHQQHGLPTPSGVSAHTPKSACGHSIIFNEIADTGSYVDKSINKIRSLNKELLAVQMKAMPMVSQLEMQHLERKKELDLAQKQKVKQEGNSTDPASVDENSPIEVLSISPASSPSSSSSSSSLLSSPSLLSCPCTPPPPKQALFELMNEWFVLLDRKMSLESKVFRGVSDIREKVDPISLLINQPDSLNDQPRGISGLALRSLPPLNTLGSSSSSGFGSFSNSPNAVFQAHQAQSIDYLELKNELTQAVEERDRLKGQVEMHQERAAALIQDKALLGRRINQAIEEQQGLISSLRHNLDVLSDEKHQIDEEVEALRRQNDVYHNELEKYRNLEHELERKRIEIKLASRQFLHSASTPDLDFTRTPTPLHPWTPPPTEPTDNFPSMKHATLGSITPVPLTLSAEAGRCAPKPMRLASNSSNSHQESPTSQSSIRSLSPAEGGRQQGTDPISNSPPFSSPESREGGDSPNSFFRPVSPAHADSVDFGDVSRSLAPFIEASDGENKTSRASSSSSFIGRILSIITFGFLSLEEDSHDGVITGGNNLSVSGTERKLGATSQHQPYVHTPPLEV